MGNKGAFITLNKSLQPTFTSFEAVVREIDLEMRSDKLELTAEKRTASLERMPHFG